MTTANGAGLVATGGGTVSTGGGSVAATGGPSLELGNVGLGLNFSTLSSTNSPATGLNLNTVAGTLTSGATSLQQRDRHRPSGVKFERRAV